MEREAVYEKLNQVFQDVFEDETLVIYDKTVAEDVEEWDSLSHLQLIAEIECKFSIKFTMGEIQNFKNVGELVDTIIKKFE